MNDLTLHLNPPYTPTRASTAAVPAWGPTHFEPPLRARPRMRPQAPIPNLTPEESVALADFIHAATARSDRTGWRAAFDECIARGHFQPLASPDQARLLRHIVERHGRLFHCYLRKGDVLAAALRSRHLEVDPQAPPTVDSS